LVSGLRKISISEMKIACTGFVSEQIGSTPAANALLLGKLLERGVTIDFFSKPSFVDPRPVVGDRLGFRFVPVINHVSDALRRRVQQVALLGSSAVRNDARCYNRLLVRRIRLEHQQRAYDLCLWMGDYAHGSVPGLPTVSFVQGPPRHGCSFGAEATGGNRAIGWKLPGSKVDNSSAAPAFCSGASPVSSF